MREQEQDADAIEKNSLWQDNISEREELATFIRDTLDAMADDVEMGERTYMRHDELYYWMTHFFLHFCGFRWFLSNIDNISQGPKKIEDFAEELVESVDQVAERASDSRSAGEGPHKYAKVASKFKISAQRFPASTEIFMSELLDKLFQKTMAETGSYGESATEATYEEVPECREFGGVFKVAEYLVSTIMQQSLKKAKPSNLEEIAGEAVEHSTSSLISLPSIEEFSIRAGQVAICKVIDTWNLKENWKHSETFLIAQSDECSDYYYYEAKFGIPTQLYPVPQATAGVIFTFEVSRVTPPVCPVQVSFQLEGNSLVHSPDEYIFQESWLLNILQSKLTLFKKLRF